MKIKARQEHTVNGIPNLWASPIWEMKGLFKARLRFECGKCGTWNSKIKPVNANGLVVAYCSCNGKNFFPFYENGKALIYG